MATRSGTVTGAEALLTEIIDFVTTDVGLTSQAPSQAWTIMRERRDNIASIVSGYTANSGHAALHQIMRDEARPINTDSPTGASNYFASAQNTSQDIVIELKQARTVTQLVMASAAQASFVPQDFTMEYSDDGSTWTNCLTVVDENNWGIFDTHIFDLTTDSNPHAFWRFTNIESGSGAYCYVSKFLLLEADGTIANHYGSEVIFRAPGLADTDNIYTGIRVEYDSAAGWENFFLNGFGGYSESASFFNQPNGLYNEGSAYSYCVPMVPLWDGVIAYNMSASGRSLRFAAKISTIYEFGYLGFFDAYAAPSQYPYPLAVGGSIAPSNTSNRTTEWLYTSTDQDHSAFFAPTTTSNAGADFQDSTLYIVDSSGEWKPFGNRRQSNITSSNGIEAMSKGTTSPLFAMTGAIRSVWPHTENGLHDSGYLPFRESLSGESILRPFVLVQRSPTEENFGELEGIKEVSGFGKSPEDTTTDGGLNYILLYNTFRSAAWEFCALELD